MTSEDATLKSWTLFVVKKWTNFCRAVTYPGTWRRIKTYLFLKHSLLFSHINPCPRLVKQVINFSHERFRQWTHVILCHHVHQVNSSWNKKIGIELMFAILFVKLRRIDTQLWYFVTIIVLTYCEKKLF